MTELCEEFCIVKPTLALSLNDESKQTLSVSDQWNQVVLAADSGLANVARLLSFVLSVSVFSAHVMRFFPVMK